MIREPWEDMVTACASRIVWQRKDDPRFRHEPLKRFPKGWRKAVKDWCKIYQQEQKQGLLLASYIKWLYGSDFSQIEIYLLMEEALLLAMKTDRL